MTEDRRLVQPIVIETGPDATHQGTVRAAALACVAAYAADRDNPESLWEEWLSGPFTKVVRRAKPAVFAKLTPLVSIEGPGGRAAAFGPVDDADVPKDLSRLQVSGTDLPRAATRPQPDPRAVVVVNKDLGMTTGKTAAQVSHALLSLALENPDVTIEDFAFYELSVAAGFETHMGRNPGTRIIVDAGRTETEPGTTTAFAYLRP
ncbi:peptidyl-tRNA hydrolase [Leifsonia sp. Leaf264]|uniref:peptidyl-tRNA hydrolase n=1 Tax=Leifsonia sp. Leaf264 TaxID=1736314 RepID=UPI0007009958|nr:peptidyl-tRNA hydrolase [Leifsonia sp. Leaf264]KQO98198.1 hypothetical protein ASF30_09055 [Leifsonia sp. Leaf264]